MQTTLSHSYCHGSTEEPLQFWRSFDRLPKWAAETPHKEMIVFRRPEASRQTMTFAEFHSLTDGIACHLLKSIPELNPGDRVLLMGTNCLEFCATFIGLHKAGLTIVSGHPGKQIDVVRLAERGDCKAMFYLPSGMYQTGSEWLRDALPVQYDFDTLVRLGNETAQGLDADKREMLRQRQALISADQAAIIFSTSGTTGEPKMVAHSHHALVNSIRFRSQGALLTNEDIFFSDRPTSHMVGSFGLFMALLDGLTLVATPATTFVGDRGSENAAWLLNTLAEERVTSGDFFGYLVHDILQKGGKPPATLRSALLSGAPTTSQQMERAMSVLPCLVNYYGSTETCMISAICPPWGPEDDPISRRDTVGRPAPHMEVMVVDQEGRSKIPLPVGSIGELWVRGYSVMRGYLGNAEQSRVALTEAGWFRSGDLGRMDQHGRVTVTGRIKDLIIVATEKISPSSIEHILLGHPAIHAAQVFGVPDERFGETIAACIILRAASACNEPDKVRKWAQTMAKWCCDSDVGESRSGLSYVPRYWSFLDAFPTGSSGKVTKAGLREFVSAGGCLFDGVEFLPSSRC